MSYYTDYSLSFYMMEHTNDGTTVTSNNVPDIILNDVVKEIDKMNVFNIAESTGDTFCVSDTWYNWEDDMRLLSSRFPELMFELSGIGEETEDMWMAYFFQGRMQYCPAKITYDEFDMSKMTDAPGGKKETIYSYQS